MTRILEYRKQIEGVGPENHRAELGKIARFYVRNCICCAICGGCLIIASAI